MLRLPFGAVALSLLVAGCSTAHRPTPPEYLDIEKAAKEFKSQREMALLYVIASSELGEAKSISVIINDEPAVLGGDLTGRFFVFCLLPGDYEIKFGDDRQRLSLKAGDRVTRGIHVYMGRVLLLMSGTTRAEPIEPAYAGPMIAERRIGVGDYYWRTKYRCRNFD